jgi:hypothetical protein
MKKKICQRHFAIVLFLILLILLHFLLTTKEFRSKKNVTTSVFPESEENVSHIAHKGTKMTQIETSAIKVPTTSTTTTLTTTIATNMTTSSLPESLYLISTYRDREEHRKIYVTWMSNYFSKRVNKFLKFFLVS